MKLRERLQAFVLAVLVVVVSKLPSRDSSLFRTIVIGEYSG